MKKEEKEEQGTISKNLEMLKVQIVSESIHSRFAILIPTIFAVFIGFSAVFYTLFYQNLFPWSGFVVGIVVLSAGTIYELYSFRKNFKKDLKRISDMIESIEQGKKLPTLEELLKR